MGKNSFGRGLADNEALAFAKNIRVSPQKLNLVAESIRGKSCESALAELEFSRRRISGEVKKLLESAIANAENNHQLDVDKLFVAEATVGKGIVDSDAITIEAVGAAAAAAAIWVLVASRMGLPVSGSHSLVAGVAGAGIAQAGWGVLVVEWTWGIGSGIQKILLGLAELVHQCLVLICGGGFLGVILALDHWSDKQRHQQSKSVA